MLSLYNKIPDTKNIQFYSSDISLESKIQERRQSKTSNIKNNNNGVKNAGGQVERVNRDLQSNTSRSNPYQDNNKYNNYGVKGRG